MWLLAGNIGIIAFNLRLRFVRKDWTQIERANAMRMEARHRVWVRRSTGSATLVSCLDDALVDELRDMVVLKFANSLGRVFDSPDIVLTITPRGNSELQTFPKRLLGPDEVLSTVLDKYYHGSQTIEEALIMDAPMSRIAELSTGHPDCCHRYLWPIDYSSYFSQMPTLAAGMSTLEAGAKLSSSILITEEAPPLLPFVAGREQDTKDSPAVLGQTHNLGKLITILSLLRLTS